MGNFMVLYIAQTDVDTVAGFYEVKLIKSITKHQVCVLNEEWGKENEICLL